MEQGEVLSCSRTHSPPGSWERHGTILIQNLGSRFSDGQGVILRCKTWAPDGP